MHVIKIDNYYGLTALTGWCEGGGGFRPSADTFCAIVKHNTWGPV